MSSKRDLKLPNHPDQTYDLPLAEEQKDEKLKVVTKQNVEVLATIDGWSPDRLRGYVDGEAFRLQDKIPPKHAIVGIDDYCLGFRAGYFNRRITRRA
ncbi:MAG: hypothetical protein OEZ08_03775 [Betaproteobacteria bacterium]|nr:hypothetical protein [Betaproteobacteria bacterium]